MFIAGLILVVRVRLDSGSGQARWRSFCWLDVGRAALALRAWGTWGAGVGTEADVSGGWASRAGERGRLVVEVKLCDPVGVVGRIGEVAHWWWLMNGWHWEVIS